MKLINKLFVGMALTSFGTALAHAQRGTYIPRTTTTSTAQTNSAQPNAEVPIGSVNIYVLKVSSLPNGQATDKVDCGSTNPNVGMDDNGECYVQSDANGGFDLTGAYVCDTPNDIIYFETIGGTAGGVNNPTLALLNIPNSQQTCGYYQNNPTTSFIVISDFGNVAAAFGAGPFAAYTKNAAHVFDSIGAYTTDYPALRVAFDSVNNVVASGSAVYQGSDSNVQQQLNTLADVVAPCIESNGTTGSGSNCNLLYTATQQGQFSGTHTPSTVFLALASMAQFPTNNVTNQYYLIQPRAPYQPSDAQAPASWLVPVNGTAQPFISAGQNILTHNTQNVTINGSNFGTDASKVTVVGAGQNLPVQSVNGSSVVVNVPNHTGKGALGVYVNGVASNFIQLTIN